MMTRLFAIGLAAGLALAGCKTANDRPGGGPVSYACSVCGKTATTETLGDAPVCHARSMNVTSTISNTEVYACACGKTKTVAKGAAAPTCCDNKAMTKQENQR
jgi:hypothetical protein